jgi:phospholipid/cholesterol/gamma-HCH transport system ATP-binding protein
LIELENLGYCVNGHQVLDGVDLHVRPGEIVAVMGLSGSGKSTLLKLIIGLLRPTAGDVRVLGQSLVGLPEFRLNKVREKIGLVFQYGALFDSMTVGENVAFGLRQHRRLPESEVQERVADALDLVGMAGTQHLLPAELSGGMRKRVSIARAMVMEPRIMLYDEPSSGLDPVMAAVIDDLIVCLRDRLGVTSVVVSHHVQNVFAIADRVAFLHAGRIQSIGSPEELRRLPDEALQQFINGRPDGPILAGLSNATPCGRLVGDALNGSLG